MEPIATETPEPQKEPTTLPVVTEYIGVRPGYCGGEPHILGRRIKVRHVAVWHEQMGMTPTEIAATYRMTLAQVHAALAYYYDHKEEIQAAIEDERRFVEELKAKSSPSKLERLLAARKPDAPDDTLPPG
jgi:uncharacterized protein (DUF433 family)